MAQSLVKLTLDSNQYEKKLRDAKRELGDFTKSIGLNMKTLTAMGLAVGAVTTAVKVVGDAFRKNEQIVDEWGRQMQSAKALYDGFLNALNTGNISGYLNNMGNIVRAAREAYDAMDALGTFNAFNQIQVEKTRTAMTESIVDFREGKVTKEQVQAAGDAYKNELQKRKNLEFQAYQKAVYSFAENRQVSPEDLFKVLTGYSEDYDKLRSLPLSGRETQYYGGGMFGGGGTYEKAVAANEEERLGEMLRNLNDTELQSLQALGAQAERTGNEIASVDRQMSRVLHGRQYGAGSGTGGTSTSKAAKLTGEQTAESFGVGFYEGLTRKLPEIIQDVPIISEMEVIDEEAWTAQEKMLDDAKEKMKALEEEAKKMQATWDLVAGSISTVGGALAGLEDPAAKVAGTLLQALATMALSYAEATERAAKLGPIAWLGFAATGLATFLTATSSIKQATAGSYATGGIVPGNTYNDGLVANVSSGELILNRAQIGNLASQLQENNRLQLSAVVSGEQIRFVLNNNSRRRGKGEYVTTKMNY